MRRVALLALLAVALTVVVGASATFRSEPPSAGAESVRIGIDHATVTAARGSVESPRAGLAILAAIVMLVALASLTISPAADACLIPVAPARRDHSRAPPLF